MLPNENDQTQPETDKDTSLTPNDPETTPETESPETEETNDGNEVKTSLNSAVTTDLENDPPAPGPSLSKSEESTLNAQAKSFEQRAIDASIGLVRVDGIDFRYIGVSPAREITNGGEPKTPGGFPITPENSTFTPLANIAFNPSVRIKDPKSGEYYYPADGITSYEHAAYEGNYLVPQEADEATTAARKQAAIDAKER